MPWFSYPPLAALGRIDRRGQSGPFDVILVSGDAYVDHPSFPAAAVARSLQALGVSVAVIAQPDWRSVDDFTVFGSPTLFFGVTSGAMDSMVANFTSRKMPRRDDRMSPGGRPGLRPKRAVQIYAQRLREAFPDRPIVLGGIEASLRRFSHYDFWEDRLRDSILVDTGADLLLYGMAESALAAVVDWFRTHPGRFRGTWPTLPQTCLRVPAGSWRERLGDRAVVLPSAAECRANPAAVMRLARVLDTSIRLGGPVLVEPHPKGDILAFPPTLTDWQAEPMLISPPRFNRRAHPLYQEPIPALEPVQFSIISHRGCLGACTFCALALHQGRFIRSRPESMVLEEVKALTGHPDFRGTIPDIGGPAANMYGWSCVVGSCQAGVCSHPQRCPNIKGNLKPLVTLLGKAAAVPGVRHVFVGSGFRYDLLGFADQPAFETMLRSHVSGQLKVAPEHVEADLLHLMRKGAGADFPAFVTRFREMTARLGKELHLVPYFILAFPGSAGGRDDGIAELVRRLRLAHEQVQEFTPTPGTLATAMYFTERDLEGRPLAVPKSSAERQEGRRSVQGQKKPSSPSGRSARNDQKPEPRQRPPAAHPARPSPAPTGCRVAQKARPRGRPRPSK
jgi:uncharacterized radical SAM protein YgiQ